MTLWLRLDYQQVCPMTTVRREIWRSGAIDDQQVCPPIARYIGIDADATALFVL